jgi:hypothetical protein
MRLECSPAKRKKAVVPVAMKGKYSLMYDEE